MPRCRQSFCPCRSSFYQKCVKNHFPYRLLYDYSYRYIRKSQNEHKKRSALRASNRYCRNSPRPAPRHAERGGRRPDFIRFARRRAVVSFRLSPSRLTTHQAYRRIVLSHRSVRPFESAAREEGREEETGSREQRPFAQTRMYRSQSDCIGLLNMPCSCEIPDTM